MKTVLYARVSDRQQQIEHQAAQARQAGFEITDVVSDDGVSGVSTRLAERPNGKRLFDMLRAGDVLVVRWVDRLGRNYEDVSETIREFMKRGVIIRTVINNMTFDGSTSDPMSKAVRDALIGFMAASAQAQAEATKEAQRAGIAYAKQNDGEAFRGRKPKFSARDVEAILAAFAEGKGVSAIAKEIGVSRQIVYRVSKDPAAAHIALARWA